MQELGHIRCIPIRFMQGALTYYDAHYGAVVYSLSGYLGEPEPQKAASLVQQSNAGSAYGGGGRGNVAA